MPNTNYVRGRKLEYEVMKLLGERFDVVMRTAGSHGMFDVIAVSKRATLFVQVKSSRGEAEKALGQIKNAELDATNTYEVWWKENRRWMKLS